jgi:thiamine-monophosphate kinase
VLVGVGDDGAVLAVPEGEEVVVASGIWSGPVDPSALPAEAVAHRTLATALAGLAAAGARPAWFTLALSLPHPDPAWLDPFCTGLVALARRFGLRLVGGDTTAGPSAVTVHAQGLVPRAGAIPLDGARPGDLVYVTGTLGDTGLGLLARRGELRLSGRDRAEVEAKLLNPTPRVPHGLALRFLASAGASLGPGLVRALGRIGAASGVGATLFAERLPVSDALRRHLDRVGGWALPLDAPGDMELCFTVPDERQAEVEAQAAGLDGGLTWVGTVERTPGLRCVSEDCCFPRCLAGFKA